MAAVGSTPLTGHNNGGEATTLKGHTTLDPVETAKLNARQGVPYLFGATDIEKLFAHAERICEPLAGPLIEHAGLTKPIDRPIEHLDLACGMGAVPIKVLQIAERQGVWDKVRVTGTDISEGQVAAFNKRIKQNGWKNVEAFVDDASACTLPSDKFDYITMNMAFMILPNPIDALKHVYRMLKPGGVFAFSTFYCEGWVPNSYAAIQAAKLPGNPDWPEDSDEMINNWAMGAWHKPNFIRSRLRVNGFEDVDVKLVINKDIPIQDGRDYCDVYRAFHRAIMGEYWTAKEREECMDLLEPAMAKYMDKIHGGKPFMTERSAWFVRCRKPMN